MSLRIPVVNDWKELRWGNACYLTVSLVTHLKFRHRSNEPGRMPGKLGLIQCCK